ncbi:C4-dicarboxylate/malic acid transporter, putative [Aspergillus fumigatus Z5]|nr:C4-dicarboxylate/malic acid transporter, putative [Aspergillus fumigatus Z5]
MTEEERVLHSNELSILSPTTGRAIQQARSSALEALHNHSFYKHDNENVPLSRRDTDASAAPLSWKKRIRHFTWAFFTLSMSTGGIANALYNESLFVPASIVSFGTMLINISQYGPEATGPWLSHAVGVLFWIDAALAVILSAGIYLLLWSTQTFTIAQMTPIWIFPAYPMLIIGPHAGILSAKLEPSRALPIIIGGTTIQGIGLLVTLTVYSAYVYRLFSQKLPRENVRPGMFVSVGPSAFTVSGLVTMAAHAKRCFPDDFMGNGALAANILEVVVNFACLWLWGLAIFFFFIATFAHWSTIGPGRMNFSMAWFSFVFPNTALITATFAIGNAFSCKPILIIGCAMIFPLILMYIFVFYMMIRAIVLRQIMWPQKGEDKDEGGFEINRTKPETPGEQTPV